MKIVKKMRKTYPVFERCKELLRENLMDDAMYHVVREFHDAAEESKCIMLNEMLDHFPFDELCDEIALGVLVQCSHYKVKLRSYSEFYKKCRKQFRKTRSRTYVNSMMVGI